MKDQRELLPTFVIAASVAARLHRVLSLGDQLHITAINATIVSGKAGESGRAFVPLAEAISTLAKDMNATILDIDQASLLFSRQAIVEMNCATHASHFSRACFLHGEDGQRLEQIVRLRNRTKDERCRLLRSMEAHLGNLDTLMKKLEGILRPVNHLVANCRIEASHIREFEADFFAVAEAVSSTAQHVRKSLVQCREFLGCVHIEQEDVA